MTDQTLNKKLEAYSAVSKMGGKFDSLVQLLINDGFVDANARSLVEGVEFSYERNEHVSKASVKREYPATNSVELFSFEYKPMASLKIEYFTNFYQNFIDTFGQIENDVPVGTEFFCIPQRHNAERVKKEVKENPESANKCIQFSYSLDHTIMHCHIPTAYYIAKRIFLKQAR